MASSDIHNNLLIWKSLTWKFCVAPKYAEHVSEQLITSNAKVRIVKIPLHYLINVATHLALNIIKLNEYLINCYPRRIVLFVRLWKDRFWMDRPQVLWSLNETKYWSFNHKVKAKYKFFIWHLINILWNLKIFMYSKYKWKCIVHTTN